MDRKTNNIAALTGAIATGKSYVSNYFKNEFCFQVIDADKIGHAILEKPEVIEIIKKEFGNTVIKNGLINRAALGKIVFADHRKLKTLNEITHPLLIKDSLTLIESLSRTSPVIFEAAVLIEAGWHKYFSTIILTNCDPDIQIRRIMNRDKTSEKEALEKIGSQISFEEKLKLADYVIDTSQGIDNISIMLDEIAEKLLTR